MAKRMCNVFVENDTAIVDRRFVAVHRWEGGVGSSMQRIADRKEFSAIASVFCYDFGK